MIIKMSSLELKLKRTKRKKVRKKERKLKVRKKDELGVRDRNKH